MLALEKCRLLSGLVLACVLCACHSMPVTGSVSILKTPGGTALFEGPVKNVLEYRCVQCHNNKVSNGGLNLQNRDLVFKGDSKGPFIVPGNPEKSRIWKVIILPQTHSSAMPADGWGLNTDDLRSFLAWIERGADWPTGSKGKLQVRSYEEGE